MKFNDCPICGHSPIIVSTSLDRGNGHGYPGHFEYHVKCSNYQCPLVREVPMFCTDDLYSSKEEVYSRLCEIWNRETVKINKLILHREDIKKY